MASSALSITTFPPVIVIVPAEAVSSSSGEDFKPSSSAVRFRFPPATVTEPSQASALFAALAYNVKLSSEDAPTMILASAPPLIPFLQSLPSAFNVPSPVITSVEPLFTLIAAPSNASAISASSEFSSAGSSRSVNVLLPSITSFTSADLAITSGAVSEAVRFRSDRIRITPSVPFFTLILPSEHSPVTRYVPAALIVSSVPSIL